jgi:cyclohexanone monooxygenase
VTYLVDAIRTMRAHDYGTVEVTEGAVTGYNADIQRRMRRTVWTTGGCASWYLDSHGNNTTLWPRTTFAFRGQTARFDIDAYRVAARTGAKSFETGASAPSSTTGVMA